MRRLDLRSARTQAVVVAFLLVAKAYLTRVLALGDGRIVQSLILEGPLLATLVMLTTVVAGRYRRSALIVLDAVLASLMFAAAVYAVYYEQVLTPTLIGMVGQAADTMDSIVGLLRPVHVLYALDIPVLVAAAVMLKGTGRPQSEGAAGGSAQHRRTGAAAVALAVLAGVVSSGVLIANAWRLPADVNSIAAAKKWGVLTYQVAALKAVFVHPEAQTPLGPECVRDVEEETQRLTGEQPAQRIASFDAGEFAGANLIVIQLEALQSGLINGVVDGVHVAPSLSEFANESWYFPRAYSQISRGNTSDAEFVFNSSLYPPPQAAASVRWGDRVIPSLPRLLKGLGYRSITFHANTARFWNRRNLYAALGFDRYYDREDLGHVEGWKWGSPDTTVFKKGLAELRALRDDGTPFYAQFITMTSHHPFRDPPEKFPALRPPVGA